MFARLLERDLCCVRGKNSSTSARNNVFYFNCWTLSENMRSAKRTCLILVSTVMASSIMAQGDLNPRGRNVRCVIRRDYRIGGGLYRTKSAVSKNQKSAVYVDPWSIPIVPPLKITLVVIGGALSTFIDHRSAYRREGIYLRRDERTGVL